MRFGVNTFIWSADCDRQILDLLPTVKERGFDGVEVPLFRPGAFPASDLRRELKRNDLECTACSILTGELSLISKDSSVRRKTLCHMEGCVKAASEAGISLIAGPLYARVGYLPGRRRTTDEWRWAVECYQSLGPVLQQYGVEIAIEPLNRFETYFLNTVADAVELCEQIGHPSVGILFDTFHANIEEKQIAAACRTAGRHLKHVHTCENDRGTPGTGHVDWPGLFRVLEELEYNGWLTIESFGFTLGDLSAAASIWRDLAPTPESIAFEGVKFLRDQVLSARATA